MSLNKMICTLGTFDIPIIQLQPPFEVDLLDANVILFGSAMSGKTKFLRTLINILHRHYRADQEQIFVLDFGGAMFDVQPLPLISAYFDNSNEEYVKRVFKILENILKENIKSLNGQNYRDSAEQPIHTTFILDNVNAFLDEPRYSAYQEKLAKICRDGLSKGITVVMTASETKGVMGYLNSFKQKIAFEMPADKYPEIFNGKVGQIGNNPGHGFANVTVKPEGVTGTFHMNLPYEVQCFYPYRREQTSGAGDSEAEFVERLHAKFAWNGECCEKTVKKYQTFPKELTEESYQELLAHAQNQTVAEPPIHVGLDYVDFLPVGFDPLANHVTAIYGKKQFGKTNLLNLILRQFLGDHPDARVVLFDDGRKQLSEEHLRLPVGTDVVRIDGYRECTLNYTDGEQKTKKLSPLQQFYVYLNDNYLTLDKRFMAGIYDVSREMSKDQKRIPSCKTEKNPLTLFVIQSKLVYLNASENKFFVTSILPQMVAVAEDERTAFLFTDVQKFGELEQNQYFNTAISVAFLLDNIAEFAGERGQKTVFGGMDPKTLKEDYARCEQGDGFFYDLEADSLKKLKFIKTDI